MEYIDKILATENYTLIIVVGLVATVLWFLPAFLALLFNRKHFRYILIACIPAGLSFIAWSGLIVWAVGGKAIGKFAKESTEDDRLT